MRSKFVCLSACLCLCSACLTLPSLPPPPSLSPSPPSMSFPPSLLGWCSGSLLASHHCVLAIGSSPARALDNMGVELSCELVSLKVASHLLPVLKLVTLNRFSMLWPYFFITWTAVYFSSSYFVFLVLCRREQNSWLSSFPPPWLHDWHIQALPEVVGHFEISGKIIVHTLFRNPRDYQSSCRSP